jgi:hypothetical protein
LTNTPLERAIIAQATLERLPPLIRKSLIEQREFREDYGFSADAVIAFGDSGVSIQRSELFKAIRAVFAGGSEITVCDVQGKTWKMQVTDKTGTLTNVFISCDEQQLSLPNFRALSPDIRTRIQSFEESAFDVNLPTDATKTWRTILEDRSLEDDEVEEFHRDFQETPVHVARSIHSEIKTGRSSVSSLVPPTRRYYERLVGAYDGSTSVRDYAAVSGKEIIDQLLAWRPYDGFLFSLLLSSHSALTDVINIDRIECESLVRAFESLQAYGDIISRLGAIEVGLRILPERPELEPILINLVELIRDDIVDDSTSAFKLLSALFVLVDGELSKMRIMADLPPFYRRLASFSHAALINRQIAHLGGIEVDSFSEWAIENRGEQYYFQNLTDMRLEPRWNPDLIAASQIKADFIGRIMISAKNHEDNIYDSDLHGLILGAEPDSLLSYCKFPRQYFPGPLEGQEASPNALPSELAEEVETQLKAEKLGPSNFIALVNSAMIFKVDTHQSELAAEALKLGNYCLANTEDRAQLLATLNGLAAVASVSRGQTLADELRILTRRFRRNSAIALSIDEIMRICLVAAASRADLNDWREYVGDWLTELAFEDFKDNESKGLYSHLQCLLHVVPELWVSCGKADAALVAYIDSFHNG